MNAEETIREALRDYVGDGDGADEAVLSAYRAQVLAPVYGFRDRITNAPFDALTRDSVIRSLEAALSRC